MPTILSELGFEVRIYTSAHPPPHVHVEKAGAVLKIDLATAKVVRIVGAVSDRDVRRAEQIVAARTAVLRDAWRTLHGGK
jgi:Domain of unknown function (DUF4160)